MQTEAEKVALKIAIVHAADSGCGAEHSVLSLHRSLLVLGHDSRLYVGRKETDLTSVVQIERRRTIPGLLRVTHRLQRTFGWETLYSPGFRALPSSCHSCHPPW